MVGRPEKTWSKKGGRPKMLIWERGDLSIWCLPDRRLLSHGQSQGSTSKRGNPLSPAEAPPTPPPGTTRNKIHRKKGEKDGIFCHIISNVDNVFSQWNHCWFNLLGVINALNRVCLRLCWFPAAVQRRAVSCKLSPLDRLSVRLGVGIAVCLCLYSSPLNDRWPGPRSVTAVIGSLQLWNGIKLRKVKLEQI